MDTTSSRLNLLHEDEDTEASDDEDYDSDSSDSDIENVQCCCVELTNARSHTVLSMKCTHFVFMTGTLVFLAFMTGYWFSAPTVTVGEVEGVEMVKFDGVVPEEPEVPCSPMERPPTYRETSSWATSKDNIRLVVVFDNFYFEQIKAYLTSSFGNWCKILIYNHDEISLLEKMDAHKTILLYLHVISGGKVGDLKLDNFRRLQRLSEYTRVAFAEELAPEKQITDYYSPYLDRSHTINFHYFEGRFYDHKCGKAFDSLTKLILALR